MIYNHNTCSQDNAIFAIFSMTFPHYRQLATACRTFLPRQFQPLFLSPYNTSAKYFIIKCDQTTTKAVSHEHISPVCHVHYFIATYHEPANSRKCFISNSQSVSNMIFFFPEHLDCFSQFSTVSKIFYNII